MKKALGIMAVIMVVTILIGTFITATYATTEETKSDGRFIAYDNGTVLDTQTKLMWAAKDNASNINWRDARSYCERYRGGGYTDWRMPTQDELAGLYDAAKTHKAECGYDAHLTTELIHLSCSDVWASESRGYESVYFSFIVGKRFWYSWTGVNHYRALPVRSSK